MVDLASVVAVLIRALRIQCCGVKAQTNFGQSGLAAELLDWLGCISFYTRDASSMGS